MKTHIATITIALLVGNISAGAHPTEHQQQPQRGAQYRQQQGCPACGAQRSGEQQTRQDQQKQLQRQVQQLQAQQQQLQQQIQQFQAQQQQLQQQVQQFQAHQREFQQQTQQFRAHQKQRKRSHQKALERFDLDGDGQLSEPERQAMHEAIKNRRNGHPKSEPNQMRE